MQTKITLGYLGFLPFAALTILPWILGETYEEISFQLLIVYGGIIISFLSGIIWGIDSTNRKNLLEQDNPNETSIISKLTEKKFELSYLRKLNKFANCFLKAML